MLLLLPSILRSIYRALRLTILLLTCSPTPRYQHPMLQTPRFRKCDTRFESPRDFRYNGFASERYSRQQRCASLKALLRRHSNFAASPDSCSKLSIHTECRMLTFGGMCVILKFGQRTGGSLHRMPSSSRDSFLDSLASPIF